MRKFIGIVLCLVAPTWFALLIFEEHLLQSGFLNMKDLQPFVGDETGTISDYLLNVWHWDGVLALLMLAALSSLVFGVLLLKSKRERTPQENVTKDFG